MAVSAGIVAGAAASHHREVRCHALGLHGRIGREAGRL
jgi:hypothetical protein